MTQAKVNFTVTFGENGNLPSGTPVPATKVRGALIAPDGTEAASQVKAMNGADPVSFEFMVPDAIYTGKAQCLDDNMTTVGTAYTQSGLTGVVSGLVAVGITQP